VGALPQILSCYVRNATSSFGPGWWWAPGRNSAGVCCLTLPWLSRSPSLVGCRAWRLCASVDPSADPAGWRHGRHPAC